MMVSLPKEKIRVVLLEGVHPKATAFFTDSGYSNVEVRKDTPEPDELKALLADAHMVGIRSRTHLTADILQDAHKLMAIGCFCIGTNQVDLVTAEQKGIPVFNAPFSSTRSVAELTTSAMIALLRGLPQKNMNMHAGVWQKSAKGSNEVRGKTLGIVGYGNIGTQVSVLASALGMRVIFYDIVKKLAIGTAEPVHNLDELLAQSDVVTLHVPATALTKNMINTDTLATMKPGSVLINYSRGSVVDIDALTRALDSGHLRGAAIDVFPTEPASNTEPFVSPLIDYPQVLLTPHVGGSTEEAQVGIGVEVAEKLVHYSDNGSTAGAVNFPAVTLPESPDAHRIINIHGNVPGVLSRVNKVFSDAGVNIAGQFLQTSPNVGYVVTDIETSLDEANRLKDLVHAVEGSIRTRILH
jgi:D-3-phosphoglycerate dehydrogenase